MVLLASQLSLAPLAVSYHLPHQISGLSQPGLTQPTNLKGTDSSIYFDSFTYSQFFQLIFLNFNGLRSSYKAKDQLCGSALCLCHCNLSFNSNQPRCCGWLSLTDMAHETFPLHSLVWNNQYLELDRELQTKEVDGLNVFYLFIGGGFLRCVSFVALHCAALC